MSKIAQRVVARYVEAGARKPLDLSYYGLEGLADGSSVTLYHGTTANFRKFDLSRSRDELVKNYYGSGIFLTPSKRVAEAYAQANRNVGFDPSIVGDLRSKNKNAGEVLQTLVDHGVDGWETYWKEHGLWTEDPPPGKGSVDMEGFQELLGGVDPNTLGDIAEYVLGSKLGGERAANRSSGPVNIFDQSTGAPDWIYNALDEVGLDSKVYRPKVYSVTVTVKNPLLTNREAQAKSARSKGYDCVVFYGSNLVQGIPEVAVFNPSDVTIKGIEVV